MKTTRMETDRRLIHFEQGSVASMHHIEKLKPLLLPPPEPPKPEIGFHAVPKALHLPAKPQSRIGKTASP